MESVVVVVEVVAVGVLESKGTEDRKVEYTGIVHKDKMLPNKYVLPPPKISVAYPHFSVHLYV